MCIPLPTCVSLDMFHVTETVQETLRGVIFDRGIYGHFPIYRMFTFKSVLNICYTHLLCLVLN